MGGADPRLHLRVSCAGRGNCMSILRVVAFTILSSVVAHSLAADKPPEMPDLYPGQEDYSDSIRAPQYKLSLAVSGVRVVKRNEVGYPLAAAKNDIEGWVLTEFTVSANGSVKDVVVIESHPATIFDEAAKEMAHQFTFKPRIENGEAVEVIGVRTKFHFELE